MTVPDPDTRSALLRQLARDGFAPADEAAAPWSAGARAAAFAAEVEVFAAAFWVLAPAARRGRYEALWGRRYGPAAARLAALEPGLDVAPTTPADPLAADLVRRVTGWFVLPARARAAGRAAWLLAEPRQRWAARARAVIRTNLPVARLDPGLFDWLAVGRAPTPVPLPGWAARAGDAPPPGYSHPVWRPTGVPEPEMKRGTQALLGGGLVLAAVAVVLLATLVLRHMEPRRPGTPGRTEFTPAEVQAFVEYHDAVRGGKPPPVVPRGYQEWRRAGSPAGGPVR